MAAVWKTLMRRKIIQQPEETSLGRVLGTWDLTFLGVGATLGIGLYVLVGKVAKETAGPSIVLSFLIAAIASAFAGLCYAEFGARVPRAGSAYVYSYVCIGEIVAFIIGWNLILEYVIGSASVAHGMSLYIDTMANDTMARHFRDIAPIDVSFMADYFDFFAFGVSVALSLALAIGVKESSYLNNIVTMLNIAVVVFVFIAGGLKAKWSNWQLPGGAAGSSIGDGGFFPFGVTGMLKGAATCFYGFIGFDCIATTGEEARNPRRSIPIAILASLGISLVAYCGTAAVVTMMVPYYEQDINSPLPYAFDAYDMTTAKWVVTIGGLFALSASLFGAMFPLPRIVYAMANDGLIFRFLGLVNARFATPMIGTLLAGLLTGVIGGLFEQGQLIDMMSIGTLLAYTIVAACVLILRYSVNVGKVHIHPDYDDDGVGGLGGGGFGQNGGWFSVMVNSDCVKRPTDRSELLVTVQVGIFCILAILCGFCAKYLAEEIGNGEIYAIVLTSIIIALILLLLISMCLQPQNDEHLSFKVPLVPIIPCLSILINIYLMMALDVSTWIRFGVWMAIGLPIYFCASRPFASKPLAPFAKPRAISESSTYVNFAYLNDDAHNEMVERKTVTLEMHHQHNQTHQSNELQKEKSSADSDSGAYFEDNEAEPDEITPEVGTNVHEMKQNGVDETPAPSVSENAINVTIGGNVTNVMITPTDEDLKREGKVEEKVEDVLGNFDHMLEKEEERCVDYAHLGVPNFRNRSVSIVSSVSNNSNSLPVELSVVAIVHHHLHHEGDDSILEEADDDDEGAELEAEEPVECSNLYVQGQELQQQITTMPLPPPLPDTPLISQPSTPSYKKKQAPPPPVHYTPKNDILPKDDVQPSISTHTPPLSVLAPPPPPPSMEKFENFKTSSSSSPTLGKIDFASARNTLKKSTRPITPPISNTSSPAATPLANRRLTPSKSEPELYTPPEDNIKLTSENIQLFKSKLAADLGHMPKNLKFSVSPAPYYSLDRRVPKDVGAHDDVAKSEIDLPTARGAELRKNSGIIDESLKNINMAEIKKRLTVLYSPGGSDPSTMYRNRKKLDDTDESGV